MKTTTSFGLYLAVAASFVAAAPVPSAHGLQPRAGGVELAMGIMMGDPLMIVKGSQDIRSGRESKQQKQSAENPANQGPTSSLPGAPKDGLGNIPIANPPTPGSAVPGSFLGGTGGAPAAAPPPAALPGSPPGLPAGGLGGTPGVAVPPAAAPAAPVAGPPAGLPGAPGAPGAPEAPAAPAIPGVPGAPGAPGAPAVPGSTAGESTSALLTGALTGALMGSPAGAPSGAAAGSAPAGLNKAAVGTKAAGAGFASPTKLATAGSVPSGFPGSPVT